MINVNDILLYLNGDGGEISTQNDDIELTNVLYNQVLLALFGGNVEAVTTGNEPPGSVREDYWANALFYPNEPETQFNSLTEKALLDNVLNSSGRINILRAVDADLQYLKTIANISTNVVILSTNSLQISVTLQEPSSQQNKQFVFIWDNAKKELISSRYI
jgi:hypothetical protein